MTAPLVSERIRVQGFHCDVLGHVNNARYLEFLEQVRWSWLELDGLLEIMTGCGLQPVMVNANLDYRRTAVPRDVLVVDLRVSRIGNRSITLSQNVVHEASGEPCVEATVTFVLIDPARGQAADIPPRLRAILERQQRGPVYTA